MLTVTEAALGQLAKALGQVDDPESGDACFRVVPSADGKLTLTVDAPGPDDTRCDHVGTTVLLVSKEIRERCEGCALDADDTGHLLLT